MMTHRGASRPMRAGGLLLLGVAAVAAVIGTASAVSNDDDQAASPPDDPGTSLSKPAGPGGPGDATTTKPTTTSAEAPPPEASSEPPATSSAPGAPGSSAPAPGTGEGTGDSGGKGDSVKSVSVRVYNNSNIKGLASQAAEDLRASGWNVVQTGNYSEGVIYTTTAYYTPGTNEKAAAEAIGAEFGMRVEPRFEGIKDSSPGVIVIVTKDYSGGKS